MLLVQYSSLPALFASELLCYHFSIRLWLWLKTRGLEVSVCCVDLSVHASEKTIQFVEQRIRLVRRTKVDSIRVSTVCQRNYIQHKFRQIFCNDASCWDNI